MPETITGAQLFETQTAGQLFGEPTGDQITEDIPSGDKDFFASDKPDYNKIYDDIFIQDKGWDYVLKPEDRSKLQNALTNTEEYDENGKRAINSLYFADLMNLDINNLDSALAIHDEAAEYLFNAENPTTAFERIKTRFKNGRLQAQIGDIAYADMVSNVDPEETLKKIQPLETQIKGDPDKENRQLWEKMVGATAEQSPLMWETAKVAPLGSLFGAVIGGGAAIVAGQLGPQAVLPEEAVTVPAGIWVGVKIGGGVRAADRYRQMAAGNQYISLLKMKDEQGRGIDPRLAKIVAHTEGVIEGGLELANWAIILSTFGVGTKTFQVAADRTIAKFAAKGTLKNLIAKYTLKFGMELTGEVATEIVQEVDSVIFEELAKSINNEVKGTEIKHVTGEELKQRFYEVAAESLRGFPLMLAPGTGFSFVWEAGKLTKQVQIAPVEATKPAVEGIIPAQEAMKSVTPAVIPPKSILTQPEAIAKGAEVVEEEVEFTKEEEVDLAKLEEEFAKEDLYEMRRLDIKTIKKGGKDIEVAGRFVIYEKATGKEVEVIRKRREAKARLAELNEEGRPIRTSGAKPKLLSITDTVEKVVTEYQALKAAFKKAAQSARVAFTEGKKEGITKVKEYYQELKTRQRERESFKKRIEKAVKAIIKPVSKNVDFFYREAIENLQQGIDPTLRTAKTQQMQERTRQFLTTATPEQIRDFPVKLAEKLAKKNIREYTIEELEQLAAEIKKLKDLGKTKRKARLAIEKAQTEKAVKQMVTSLTGSEDLPPVPPQGYGVNVEGTGIKVKAAYLWTLHISRILDWIDGLKGTFKGLAHQLFYDQINTQTDKAIQEKDRRIKDGEDKMKEFGVTNQELSTIVDFGELSPNFQLKIEQMMKVYVAIKNNLSLDALVNGNRITLKMAEVITSNLDKKYKDLADWILSEYESNYPRLRQAYIELTNEDLGHESNYSPIVRLEKNEQVFVEDIASQLAQRLGLKKGYVDKGFTINRKNIEAEHQKPMDLNMVTEWNRQVVKHENFIHLSKTIKDLRTILADDKFRRAMKSKFGEEGLRILSNYLDRVANPYIYKGFDSLSRASRVARTNLVIAYLGFNLLSLSKVPVSLVFYLQDAGIGNLVSSICEFAADPKKMWDKMIEKQPQLEIVNPEREIAEIEQRRIDLNGNTLNDSDFMKLMKGIEKINLTIGHYGMLGIRYIDHFARVIGSNAVYEKVLAETGDEMEARQQAQNSTLRGQPSGFSKDLPQLYATSEFLNWFTMFTLQLNNIWNISTYDTFAYWKNENYRKMALTMLGVSLNALIIWMLTNKRLPEDEDDFLDMASDEFVSSIPLFGTTMMAGKEGYGGEIPPAEIAKTAGRVLTAEDKETAMKQLLEGLAAVKGVPVVALKRIYRTIEEENPMILAGEPKD